jgi:hypothetical protein
MATKVYGRSRRSSGGPTDHHHKRGIYFTDVSRSRYEIPKPGLVGPKVSIQEGMPHPKHTQMRPTKAHLRLRRLPCGHGVFMVKGQFPDADTFCIQCRDGVKVR